MARLSQNDIEDLLRRPIISVVSTIRPDDTPHMTPVWHMIIDGDAVIAIEDSSVKARNVRANPKAALCVVTNDTPQRWGLFSGNARLSTEGVDEFVRDISVHYMGEEAGARYAEQAVRDIDFVILRITPTRTSGSDGKESSTAFLIRDRLDREQHFMRTTSFTLNNQRFRSNCRTDVRHMSRHSQRGRTGPGIPVA